jgi:DNA-binding protein Fis
LYDEKPRKAYSVSKQLKYENKINELFEIQLSQLSLEEIIALKLELATREMDGKMYGLPIWKNLPTIIKDAVLKTAMNGSATPRDAARFLGIKYSNLRETLKNYGLLDFFKKNT